MSAVASRRRLLCREIPRGLAALAQVLHRGIVGGADDDAAFAAFDADCRAMGPELLAQAARQAGLADAEVASAGHDALIKALWQRARSDLDVG